MRKKGFTLIELLVVISIIALLVSILMPSLGKARELAERASCMATLNGAGKAWVMYMDSNDDSIPYIGENGQDIEIIPPLAKDCTDTTYTFMKAMEDYIPENGWQCASKTGKKYFRDYNTSYQYLPAELIFTLKTMLSGMPQEDVVSRVKKVGDQYSSSFPVFSDMYDPTYGASHTGKKKTDNAGVVVFWDSHVEFQNEFAMEGIMNDPEFEKIAAALLGL